MNITLWVTFIMLVRVVLLTDSYSSSYLGAILYPLVATFIISCYLPFTSPDYSIIVVFDFYYLIVPKIPVKKKNGRLQSRKACTAMNIARSTSEHQKYVIEYSIFFKYWIRKKMKILILIFFFFCMHSKCEDVKFTLIVEHIWKIVGGVEKVSFYPTFSFYNSPILRHKNLKVF